jgi:hypothetical protein
MVLTLRQDIVKLVFEKLMGKDEWQSTKYKVQKAKSAISSECHRDAVFVCGGDRFIVFDRTAETGDWCQACDLRFSVTRHC